MVVQEDAFEQIEFVGEGPQDDQGYLALAELDIVHSTLE
jgi:hypothetical protein